MKESVNCNGQQFHYHRQSEQTPPASTHRTRKRQHYDVGNPDLGLVQAQHVAGLNSE